jgi:hypothetical protein
MNARFDAAQQGLPRWKIHYSRVIRLEGQDLAYWQAMSEQLWGQSVIERCAYSTGSSRSTPPRRARLSSSTKRTCGRSRWENCLYRIFATSDPHPIPLRFRLLIAPMV